jgi:hypothetical protein
MALPDSGGREHLLADYSRIAMPGMRTIEHGKFYIVSCVFAIALKSNVVLRLIMVQIPLVLVLFVGLR